MGGRAYLPHFKISRGDMPALSSSIVAWGVSLHTVWLGSFSFSIVAWGVFFLHCGLGSFLLSALVAYNF